MLTNRCKHCQREHTGEVRRGLCRRCYQHVGIRLQYPIAEESEKYAGVSFTQRQELPSHPTEVPPRTPEKLLVFEQRYAERTSLFHPDDCPGDLD